MKNEVYRHAGESIMKKIAVAFVFIAAYTLALAQEPAPAEAQPATDAAAQPVPEPLEGRA